MAAGRERLISLAKLQTFRMAGAKQRHVKMWRLSAGRRSRIRIQVLPGRRVRLRLLQPFSPAPLKRRLRALGGDLGGFSVSSIMSHLLTRFYTLPG